MELEPDHVVLEEEDQARFLEQRLEAFLGIEDQRVAGELDSSRPEAATRAARARSSRRLLRATPNTIVPIRLTTRPSMRSML